MINIEIYTKKDCPFCIRAKHLLDIKGVLFKEIPIDTDKEKLIDMISRTGGSLTVPQIFINSHHIGGCDNLYELEAQGKLDMLLAKQIK